MNTILAEELLKMSPLDGVFVDVRSPDEFAFEHIPGSINIPLENLERNIAQIPTNKKVYLICQSGLRSQTACGRIEGMGLKNAVTVMGGIRSYAQAGGAIKRGKAPMPLMRQVQISAGSLVVLGVVGAHLIHPGFIYLSAFVGAGLVFAGVSGTCGMGMLLSKMPWNKSMEGKTCER